MSSPLFVHYEQRLIGQLQQLSSGTMAFQYDIAWAQSTHSFPLSLCLPLDGSFTHDAGHHYFANLLPEANVRQQICRSLGISTANDFELLKAIGGDCAGALTITSESVLDSTELLPRYESVSEEQLSRWSLGTPGAFSAITGQNEVRLSLAGAQDKLPVYLDGDTIRVPIGNTPSTHLLKFASPFYSHLPENETFMTLLASTVELPVVEVRLRSTTRARVAIITRYDRLRETGRYRRLHQEDFCQALGIGPLRKYEKEGGPGLRQCAEVIRRHTAFPLVELQKLLRWALFNLVTGNADAHGKNLSLLYHDVGALRLAPFYDLVCTRNYKKISRHLAMQIGGAYDPDLVGSAQLQQLAADLQFRPNLVLREAERLMDQVQNALPVAIAAFQSSYGDSPVTLRLPIIIRKQIRRLRDLLKNV